MTPEQKAREQIDATLVASGWAVHDYKAVYRLAVGSGVERIEAVGAAVFQRAGRLRQSILQKAFAGELA